MCVWRGRRRRLPTTGRRALTRTTINAKQTPTNQGFNWKADDGRIQHDAHELVRLLLDWIDRSLHKTAGAPLVPTLFRGEMVWSVRCRECGTVSERSEDFFDVFVNVRGKPTLAVRACVRAWWVWVVLVVGTCRCPPRARTSSTTHTLTPATISTLHIQTPTPQAGLDEAFKREVLDGENKYACDKCARKTAADRGVALRTLPPVLFVSLNRFEYDMLTAQRRKARTPTCVCACVGRVGLRGDSQKSGGLDGRTSIPPKPQHDRLTLSHHQPKPTKNS